MIGLNTIIISIIITFGFFNISFSSENFFKEGVKLFEKKKYKDAKFFLERSIVFDPKHANSYLYLAKIYKKEEDQKNFKSLLGDGEKWGISIKYKIQHSPEGLAHAMILSEDFLAGSQSALILGDNLFHGSEIPNLMRKANANKEGATIFTYPVKDPERYGIINFDNSGKPKSIEEKPTIPKSNYAITGLYFYDSNAINYAKSLKPSSRGELEISSLNKIYLNKGELKVNLFSRGTAWLDTGTFETLHEASSYIKTLENRQGLKVGCPEEIAWRNGWINNKDLIKLAEGLSNSGYGDYLNSLLNRKM